MKYCLFLSRVETGGTPNRETMEVNCRARGKGFKTIATTK